MQQIPQQISAKSARTGQTILAAMVLFAVILVQMPAQAAGFDSTLARRVALVVGINDYSHIDPLKNAVNDASAVARKLEKAGFEVELLTNASRRSFHRAVRNFRSRLQQGDVGLFWYAGHGIEADNVNWLIPGDAKLEVEADLEVDSISASWVMDMMEGSGSGLNIVVLDACRNNPLKRRTRGTSRGLGLMVAPSGSLLAYSAAPGQVADDGPDGGHSAYAEEFMKAMEAPGLALEQVFKRTNQAVWQRSNGKQEPWIQASLRGDFYFYPDNDRHLADKGSLRHNAGIVQRPQPDVRPGSDDQAGTALSRLSRVTTIRRSHVRAKPNLFSRRIDSLDKGERVFVLEEGKDGRWLKVALGHNGEDEGWLETSDVTAAGGSNALDLFASTGAPVDNDLTAEDTDISLARHDIHGVWRPKHNNWHVAVGPCGHQAICGRVVKARASDMLGLPVILHMQPEGRNKWGGGKIVLPKKRKAVQGSMHLQARDVLMLKLCPQPGRCRVVPLSRAKNS